MQQKRYDTESIDTNTYTRSKLACVCTLNTKKNWWAQKQTRANLNYFLLLHDDLFLYSRDTCRASRLCPLWSGLTSAVALGRRLDLRSECDASRKKKACFGCFCLSDAMQCGWLMHVYVDACLGHYLALLCCEWSFTVMLNSYF